MSDLDWANNAEPDLAGYNVYRSTTSGFTPSAGNRIASGLAASAYSDTGVSASTTYYYRVTAVDQSGNESAPPSQASATTPAPPPASPTSLGTKASVGSGEDPDLAVATDGTLQVVYHRSGTIYYRRGTLAGGFGPEVTLGSGTDPRVDLDAGGNPHVAAGSAYAGGATVRYWKWTGAAFTAGQDVVTSGSNRKPRIEVDGAGNAVVSFEDRNQTQSVLYVRVSPTGSVSAQTVVGTDNNGGLGIDSTGRIHFTWRSTNVYYNTSTGPGNAGTSVQITPAASDFSELDLSASGAVHVAGEVASAGGIYSVTNAAGSWGAAQTYAAAQVSGALPDDVNPAIAAAANGRRYIPPP